MNFTYGTLCSGIEGAAVAFSDLPWTHTYCAEVEPFPCQLLAERYPAVPNYGDITKHESWPYVDLLVAGTPCQSFSQAGKRAGLQDVRGQLALRFVEILKQSQPRWVLWENVPGVLSSGGGRDFATFLEALAQVGYGLAWRVLDARFFGVAQRRRRVFVVGYLGAWEPAAECLFGESARGSDVAAVGKVQPGQLDAGEHATRILGFTPKGCPTSSGFLGLAPTLCTKDQHSIIGFTDKAKPDADADADAVPCLTRNAAKNATGVIGWTWSSGSHNTPNSTPCLCGSREFGVIGWNADTTPKGSGDFIHTLRAQQGGEGVGLVAPDLFRRLTVTEWERLQGFPDGYTAIAGASDAKRRKALGNSFAVPVVKWIGERIALVNEQWGWLE